MEDRVELLSLRLLEKYTDEIKAVEEIKTLLKKEIGWCYPLDIVWILHNIKKNVSPGGVVIDAGAGGGIVQFLLAEMGFNVISVDFSNRIFTESVLQRYSDNLYFINSQESEISNKYTEHLSREANIFQEKTGSVVFDCKKPEGIEAEIQSDTFNYILEISKANLDNKKCPGNIFIYKSDFRDLSDLPDSCVEAVVSCSAIEHSDEDTVKQSVSEFARVLKNNAPYFITTSASIIPGETYFHEPSQGYCYSKETIYDLFDFSVDVPNNMDRLPQILSEIQSTSNNYLCENLASFYFKSGNNGMPYGKWDIQYLPVGVSKINRKEQSAVFTAKDGYLRTIDFYRNCEIQYERKIYISLLARINALQKDIDLLERKRESLIREKNMLRKSSIVKAPAGGRENRSPKGLIKRLRGVFGGN